MACCCCCILLLRTFFVIVFVFCRCLGVNPCDSERIISGNNVSNVSFFAASGQPLNTECIALLASTPNITSFYINIADAITDNDFFPTNLFSNSTSTLRQLEIVTFRDQFSNGGLAAGTFDGLEKLESLRLEGLTSIQWISESLFRPLRSLRSLTLVGVGQQFVSYSVLTAALRGLESTPLTQLTLDNIHSLGNAEKEFDFELLEIPNVTLDSFVFVNNDINIFKHRLSKVSTLSSLRYYEFSTFFLSFSAFVIGFDTLMCLEQLEELRHAYVRAAPVVIPSSEPPIDYIKLLDPDIVKRLLIANISDHCYQNIIIPFSPSLRRLFINRMDFYRNRFPEQLCFAPNYSLEYMDLSGSPIPNPPIRIRGFKALKYFDFSAIDMKTLPPELFTDMPALETLLLGGNSDIGDLIAADVDALIFRTLDRLMTLNLSDCGIEVLPPREFTALASLVTLNLSSNLLDNRLVLTFPNSSRLRSLDLSANRIGRLTKDVTEQLERIADGCAAELNIDDARTSKPPEELTVNLSSNPLSCQCDALEFVRWLRSSKVRFAAFDTYRCSHPNGSLQILISAIDLNSVANDCSVIADFRNKSSCPCDVTLLGRLTRIVASLTDHYCYYPASPDILVALSVVLDLVAANAATSSIPHWCNRDPWSPDIKLIVPLTVCIPLVVLLVIGIILCCRLHTSEKNCWCMSFVVSFCRRRPVSTSPSSALELTVVGIDAVEHRERASNVDEDCNTIEHADDVDDAAKLASYVVFVHDAAEPASNIDCDYGAIKHAGNVVVDHDAFVCSPDADIECVKRVVTDALERRSLQFLTSDIVPGSYILDELLQRIERSRVVIFVVTAKFAKDGWCMYMLRHAYTHRPKCVLPVVVRNEATPIKVSVDNVVLSNVLRTNKPLYVETDVDGSCLERFQSELYRRIQFIIDTSSPSFCSNEACGGPERIVSDS